MKITVLKKKKIKQYEKNAEPEENDRTIKRNMTKGVVDKSECKVK